MDSLSLCSGSAASSSLDDEQLPFQEDLPIAQLNPISKTSDEVVSRESSPKIAPATPTKEFVSENLLGSQTKLRSSILRRFAIRPWRREYHFQLELDKSFAEEGE